MFARGTEAGVGTLEVRQLRALDAVYTDAVAELLVERVPGITKENSYPIQLCLNELIQNVFDWAESPIGCIVLARWYRNSQSLQLTVVDRGIGIPAALRRSVAHDFQDKSDAEIIEAAVTTEKLTSRPGQFGGLGLKTVREVVLARGGRLTVMSLGAKLTWSRDKLTRDKLPALRGTAVEIEILPGGPVEKSHEEAPIF